MSSSEEDTLLPLLYLDVSGVFADILFPPFLDRNYLFITTGIVMVFMALIIMTIIKFSTLDNAFRVL